MFTIIGGDGKEYGPVSADQVRVWLTSGRANLQTKTKAAGTEEWRTLGDFAEFTGAAAASQTPPITTTPVVVTDAKAFADDLIARAAPLDVFGCLDRSFKLWTANFGPLVGVTLLVLIAQAVLGMIPLVGILSRLLLTGVFYGGIYYYYLGKARGEPRSVGDGFAGFSRSFVPLLLASLFTSLITIALILLCCAPVFMFAIKLLAQGTHHLQTFPTFSPLALFGLLIGFVGMVYLSISWLFTFALIIDQGLEPWTAMEVSRRVVAKQWFRVFFVAVLGGLLSLLGLIALFIGIFLTLPLSFGAIIFAYESLCRPPPRS